jgi:COP9 signalosome complex subunit 2
MLALAEKYSNTSRGFRAVGQIYSHTLIAFRKLISDRLWVKTSMKLARLLYKKRRYGLLAVSLQYLHNACRNPDGTEDISKGTAWLEVHALDIQMRTDLELNSRIEASHLSTLMRRAANLPSPVSQMLYNRALSIRSAVPHPRVMAIIRECGGKMHLAQGQYPTSPRRPTPAHSHTENWEQAQMDFFDSFRLYDEAGAMERIRVLKYLVLTTMLTQSNINPFDSRETKVYQKDPGVVAMTRLVGAYQRDDMFTYMDILRENPEIVQDSFIADNIDEITRTMRIKAMMRIIGPYNRCSIAFIAGKLNMDVIEVKDILCYLIVFEKIRAKADVRRQTIEIQLQFPGAEDCEERLRDVIRWSKLLKTWWPIILSRDGYRPGRNIGFWFVKRRARTEGNETRPRLVAKAKRMLKLLEKDSGIKKDGGIKKDEGPAT